MNSVEYTKWAALEALELPEPYRMDLRFAFLVTQIGGWLGVKPQPRLDKVYNQMRKCFDTTSEQADEDGGMEGNLKATLRGMGQVFKLKAKSKK